MPRSAPAPRRILLQALAAGLGAGLTGCAVKPPRRAVQPPIVISALTDVLAAAGLAWLVLIAPEQLVRTSWLKPSLSRILRDERLDLLAAQSGIDLRLVPELALAGYRSAAGGDDDETIIYLARHRRHPLSIERLFRRRLTSGEQRLVRGEQLVLLWGNIGRRGLGFVALGADVVGFQYGGSRARGPAQVALLYADGQLRRIPTVLAGPALPTRELLRQPAPLKLYLPGPFEGAYAKGARGLLAAASDLAATLTPTEARTLALRVRLDGDYSAAPDKAAELLLAAWDDLARSDLGHLLGLYQPAAPPQVAAHPGGLSLAVGIAPAALFEGLAAATMDSVRDILK